MLRELLDKLSSAPNAHNLYSFDTMAFPHKWGPWVELPPRYGDTSFEYTIMANSPPESGYFRGNVIVQLRYSELCAKKVINKEVAFGPSHFNFNFVTMEGPASPKVRFKSMTSPTQRVYFQCLVRTFIGTRDCSDFNPGGVTIDEFMGGVDMDEKLHGKDIDEFLYPAYWPSGDENK